MRRGGGRGARREAENFYDVMDRSGEMTDGMAALASRPTGTLLVPLSSGSPPLIFKWKMRGVMEGLGAEGADLERAHD